MAATGAVTQPGKATEAFFPTSAREGLAYNLLLLNKVRGADAAMWRDLFGTVWIAALDAAAAAGLMYVIDLRLYETLRPQQAGGFPASRPATVLVQDAPTKVLTPELVRVAGVGNEANDLQPAGLDHALRLGLCPPGGQGLAHGLRHLDRPRVPLAHRPPPRSR